MLIVLVVFIHPYFYAFWLRFNVFSETNNTVRRTSDQRTYVRQCDSIHHYTYRICWQHHSYTLYRPEPSMMIYQRRILYSKQHTITHTLLENTQQTRMIKRERTTDT